MNATKLAMKEAALRVLDEHGERIAGDVLDAIVHAQFEACRAANVDRIISVIHDYADLRRVTIEQEA